MSSRVRIPERTVLPISNGDTITVKKHLNAGEFRAMVRTQYVTHPVTGDVARANPVDMGVDRIMAYLLDWTITDHADRPIVIAQQSADVVRSALDAITPETYTEILKAIDAHDDAMRAVREQKKTIPAGETIPSDSSESQYAPV